MTGDELRERQTELGEILPAEPCRIKDCRCASVSLFVFEGARDLPRGVRGEVSTRRGNLGIDGLADVTEDMVKH